MKPKYEGPYIYHREGCAPIEVMVKEGGILEGLVFTIPPNPPMSFWPVKIHVWDTKDDEWYDVDL